MKQRRSMTKGHMRFSQSQEANYQVNIYHFSGVAEARLIEPVGVYVAKYKLQLDFLRLQVEFLGYKHNI